MTHTTRAHGRRILSMLMAFVLALSLLPTAAFAAGGGGATLKEEEQRTTPMSSQRLTSWRASIMI